MRLSVIIPMYNEEERIVENLRTLVGFLEKELSENDFEVIAVNDGSKDHTKELVSALERELPPLRLLSYPVNRGKGGALKVGMLAAKGDFVLFTDSDLAYGAELILTFLSEFEKGAGEVILGSRALHPEGYEGYTFLRKQMSSCYLRLVKTVAGFHYTDSQCGFKGFSNEAAKSLFSSLETEGFAFDLEILLETKRKGYKVKELPCKILIHGKSSIHPLKDALKMLKDLHHIKKRNKEREKTAKTAAK